MSIIQVRAATVDDASLILEFIIELAVYEKARDEVKTNVNEISETLFSPDASAKALICTIDDVPVGYAVYFFNYSTWLGKNGLYLEDVYVTPEFRGRGAGKALLKYMANIALEKKCARFEWAVLDWNQPAIDFYQCLGAKAQREWINYRMTGQALQQLAKE